MTSPLRVISQRCKRLSPLLAAPAALLLIQGQAKAVLNFNIFESGGSVIVRTSGSLTLPNFSFTSFSSSNSGSWITSFGLVATGPSSNAASVFKISGTTSIPGTTDFSPASSAAGNTVGIGIGPGYATSFGAQILYLDSYAGGELFSEAVYSGKALATDFGITTSGLVGTWTLLPANAWDSYNANDTINLIVGAPASVPGPLPLLGAGAAFGWSRKLRRRIGSASSGNSEA